MNHATTQLTELNVHQLVSNNHQIFSIQDDESMHQLLYSIQMQGVLSPVLVNYINDQYVILDGHRRWQACIRLGISHIPCFVYQNLAPDASILILASANLAHREHILISERARAYKAQLQAAQSILRSNAEHNCYNSPYLSRDALADIVQMSGRNIHRYIHLTHLISDLMHMVDIGQLAVSPAYELSFMNKVHQEDIIDAIHIINADDSINVEPNITHSQARIIRRMGSEGRLDLDAIIDILSTPKPNQKDKLHIAMDDIAPYMPKGYSISQCTQYLITLARKEYELKLKNKKINNDISR